VTRVLIAGVSTRAAAASAVRAGLDVTTVDAFGDCDQPRAARVLRVGRPFTAAAAARAARDVACDAVVYLSSFENHPAAVAALARGRTLWGNPPAVLARARDARLLAALGGAPIADSPSPAGRWLIKPRASGGGAGVRPWTGGPVPAHAYLQEFVPGTPGSVVFVADGRRAVVLGVSQQIVGDAAFGASGFRYCGNILGPAPVDGASVADAVTRRCALVGLNGIDFIARDGEPVPIEVNPRWSGSMELVERAHGVSLFAMHAEACGRRTLPGAPLTAPAHAYGKAIVFARGAVQAPDTTSWLEDRSVADIPHPGERIAAGSPICTVFATAATVADCHDALVRRAAAIYEAVSAGVGA
jgi:predicted ATP-grasp superfamily ATP-dependent carboligase